MIFLVKISLISFIVSSGVNYMELSRVSNYLATNPSEYNNSKIEKNDNPNITFKHDLLSPSDLFGKTTLAKEIDTTLDLFPEDSVKTINKDSVVLHVGDSHTAGIYGKEMDSLLRKVGAKVTTVGSSGSSPSWWLNGTSTKSGFYMKDQDGNIDNPSNWKDPHATPKLVDLINKYQPNIIIFSLGANLIHNTPEKIEAEVKSILKVAQKNNTKIIWIAPPNGRSDKKPKEVQDSLYENIKNVTDKYGIEFIDSRPFTNYPDNLKGDGVHFWGKEGAKTAKEWANAVFSEIQK